LLGILDPHSPFPRYYQIYSTLREGILSGEYQPGHALPAERQVAD
jgi:DNA-binding GntR family transcriptional regulator